MIDIIDAGIGNVASVANMLKRVGAAARLISDPEDVARSEQLVLPGVGSFAAGMAELRAHGVDEAVRSAAARGASILGICLGMQLLFDKSEEGGPAGLGLIRGRVERFRLSDTDLKIPHMGWNVVKPTRPTPLLSDEEEQRFYFVHSYHAVCDDPQDVAGVTHYGYDFACAIARDNVWGVQFHPEKSHRFGMALLKRFADRGC